MNYFELYPGDYLRDTSRLSLTDHGAYLKLLMAYYGEEEPLPADYDELFNIAGAVKTEDKKAVKKVADKYFPIGKDGLRHNGRADEEIAKAAQRMEGADERKANVADRKRRSRERRAAMFEALRDVGIIPDAMATSDDLQALVAVHVTPELCVTLGVTPRDKSRHVTRDSTATRSQTPDPTKSKLSGERIDLPPAEHPARAPALVGTFEGHNDPTPPTPSPTAAGQACRLMREAGCPLPGMSPSNQNLVAALAEGVTPETLADAVREAIDLRIAKPFAWAIATARGRHAEGPRPATTGPPRNGAPSKSMQALSALEALKSHEPLAPDDDRNRPAKAAPALAGPNTRR